MREGWRFRKKKIKRKHMHTPTYHPVIRNQVYRQAAAGVRLSEREGGKDQRESRWRGEVKKKKKKLFSHGFSYPFSFLHFPLHNFTLPNSLAVCEAQQRHGTKDQRCLCKMRCSSMVLG